MCEAFEAVKALRRPPLLSVSPGGETHGKIAVERGAPRWPGMAGYGSRAGRGWGAARMGELPCIALAPGVHRRAPSRLGAPERSHSTALARHGGRVMRARWRWGTGHAGAGSLASPGSRGRRDAPKPEGSGWRSLSVRERGGARALALPVPDDPGGETERGDRPPCVLDARGGREDGKRGVGPRLGDVPGGLGAAQPASDVSGDVPEGAGTSSGVGRVLWSRGCRGARLGDMVPVFGGRAERCPIARAHVQRWRWHQPHFWVG